MDVTVVITIIPIMTITRNIVVFVVIIRVMVTTYTVMMMIIIMTVGSNVFKIATVSYLLSPCWPCSTPRWQTEFTTNSLV